MQLTAQNLYDHLRVKAFILALLLLVSSVGIAFGQDEEEEKVVYKTRIKIEYFKKGDDSKLIKATFTAMIDRKPTPIENILLSFYDQTDSSVIVGQSTTDEKGVAMVSLPSDYIIGRDTAKSTFGVEFDGTEEYRASSNEIMVRDAKIEATYEIIDSVYTVTVMAYEIVNGEAGQPLSDMDVYVYVQRMFSQLKVGEGWLQDGEATIEVPQNIPGDEQNNLQLIVKIPESEIYGTIENEGVAAWGIEDTALIKHHKERRRALWKPMAPLWMVITLSILIAGVFYHYLLIVYKLMKIKKLYKKSLVE